MNIELLLTRASTLKIAIVGDFIEDRYFIGSADRISPEVPVPVVTQQLTFSKPGGAGNVFMNLVNLGVQTDLYCIHSNGNYCWDMEHNDNIHTHEGRHAVKTRIMSGSHHLLRVDNEIDPMQIEWLAFNNYSWWKTLEEKMGEYNAIVLCDYGKGVLSDSVINGVIEMAIHYKIPVIVDAKKDFRRFKGATVIKCNKKEYEALLDRFNPAEKFGAQYFVVTCGEMGISAYSNDGTMAEGFNAHSVNIVDVCGAGDTVTAILSMCLPITDSINPIGRACELANIAAAEVCTHPGVHAISKEELIKRFNEVNG